MNNLSLALSPQGHVYLLQQNQLNNIELNTTEQKIVQLFAQSPIFGLLHLGIQEFSQLSPECIFWQSFVRIVITQICRYPEVSTLKVLPEVTPPTENELLQVISQAPFIHGFEYLNADNLYKIWQDLYTTLQNELKNFSGSIPDYFQSYNSNWNSVGRVCFHLAENKNNNERPFAFMATYTTKLGQKAATQHLPLKRALQDYAGEKNHAALLALLVPVQKAAEIIPLIKKLVDNGEVFQALTWSIHEAHQFLTAVPEMEQSGIVVRVPNWWNAKNPLRSKVNVTIGNAPVSVMGLDSLLDFNIQLSLSNGEILSQQEWQELMNSNDGLVKVKGQWVEVNKEHLNTMLSHWNDIKNATKDGMSLAECLRLLSGAGEDILNSKENKHIESAIEWSSVVAGDWLNTILNQLRDPSMSNEKSLATILNQHLQAILRPYQLAGVNWLWFLYKLKLGACLADDMGLGKTIQVIAFFLLVKHQVKQAKPKYNLLIVPASLLGNWQSELMRFAPSLTYFVMHSSTTSRDIIMHSNKENLPQCDLIITTYAFVNRLEWLSTIDWHVIVLDEAQLIKNAATKQTRAIKKLTSYIRFTLTGTPIENRLSDLWSLFDFTSPGLLGSSSAFTTYEKNAIKEKSHERYKQFLTSIRSLTQPYILRRLKSDKKIIVDLPDKTEIQTFCGLSKEQIKLYELSVRELKNQLEVVDGVKRRGLVLSFLLRFKQICNHPAQWLGYGDYHAEHSGKFLRLKELCEEIAAKQEKVLVFTQFTEIIPALVTFLEQIFGCRGLSLHGSTAIKQRAGLVAEFQEEQGPPFFVLSLKAGGTGLTLTRASHVIHFDRWWNPAVENQATDRAYRIGQKHLVVVHKFICRGTIEEKIDSLISSKKELSQDVLQVGNEMSFTELNNDQLMDIISLDIHKVLSDN